ncbi:hypothetical protein T440DRAFT_553821 [Plenodomus tracheiphilus IPT5]|uniref:BRCT domain-containing protein n=1 Tax=Plenodomus tracheiphilus IPT5 TaxID=1408161 RepID=A0A6A7BBS6_9PLEO|nr:hypothetical protein T440DRAFT_553821 [Plenodomus tracheiphilus IPT5]
MAESQALTVLGESFYDDPSQLSQALQQRTGSARGLHFTTSTESPSSGNTVSTGIFVFPQLPGTAAALHTTVALARPDHAPSPRRAATTRNVKPSLPKHNSAPTSTAFTAEFEGALKMHHTFNGVDAPGDTQPDSQMHKQWTSGMLSSVLGQDNHMPPPKSLFVEHEDDEDNDMGSDELEVVESSQEAHNANITSPTVIDVDEQGEFAPDSLAQTSPFKFNTPALVSRKRASSGQLMSSAARTNTTPGTVASASAFGAAFGSVAFAGGPAMSLTQIWNNTQAPTSPVAGAASEDVAFTRPSPNFTNVRHSSPGPAYSSPIKGMRPDTPASEPMMRSSSEPRAEYVTMKQSQEKRRGSNGEEIIVVPQQDSWEELSRQMQQRIARKQFHQQAARSLSHISAPPSLSRKPRKPKMNMGYPSPNQSRVTRSVVGDEIREDDDDFMDDLSPPEAVESHNSDNNRDQVPTARATVIHNSNDNSVQVPKTSSHPYRTPSGQASGHSSQRPTPSSQLQRESHLRAPGPLSMPQGTFRPQSTTDSIAIMDSQPDVLADFDSVPPPKLLRFPSSPSQNQYSIHQTTMGTKTGYTSQVISSSMPPMPPKSSPDEPVEADNEPITPEDGRVPSSPPMMTHDEDLVYDEHGYDEYAEGVVDDEDAAGSVPGGNDDADDDVVMQDESELPGIKDEPIKETMPHAEAETHAEHVDLVQPLKVDLESSHELPETLEDEEQTGQEDSQNETEVVFQGDCEAPGLVRQDTIPETDAFDETQPSAFSNNVPGDSGDSGHNLPNQTNSTEPFQTAQEEQSGSEVNRQNPHGSKEAGSFTLGGNRIRSIDDIHNLPETQHSVGDDDFEFPRLSGLDDEGAAMLGSSPAPPSAKKRKITYKAKRGVFRSPTKPASSVLSDAPASSPESVPLVPTVDTPPIASGQLREDRGANAAAHAREQAESLYSRPATLKAKTLPRSAKLQASKKGALKSVSRSLLQSLSSPDNSPSKPKVSAANRKRTPMTPTKTKTSINDRQGDTEMPDVEYSPDELARSTPPAVPLERLLERLSQESAVPIGEVLVPYRVFASWPGSHYYPATCIGRAASRQLRIRYDDGNTTTMEAVHVRSLDLRAGDHVKVDEPGMKKHTYVVVGFKDKIDDLGGEQFPATDRYGHATIVVEEKRRDSMPAAKVVQPAEHISVPMASIYLTTGLWNRIRDRKFNLSPPASPAKSASHIGTPVAEALITPSFTRRGTAIPSFLKSATARAASVASTNRSGSAVFANMAFVLTSTADDFNKDALAKTIKSNGGMVLEQGFHELFDYESSDVPLSSQSRRRSSPSPAGTVGLTLKPAYKDLGFVALISDSHSRSTKYIQALALNVPCLHLRWIQDSLAAARAAPFIKYLLPAGVSKFLDPQGVVRSRTMAAYDPAAEDLTFDTTLQDRPLLLYNQAVLLVTGKSKKEIEKRQPFVFLTHALGSTSVGRCVDLADASEMLTEGHWDWVYVDNNGTGVLEAAAELFGTEIPATATENKAKKGKKRKRDEGEERREELVARVQIGGKKIRITCSEFVIQSLILGALVEE